MPKRIIPRKGDKPNKSLLAEEDEKTQSCKEMVEEFIPFAKKGLGIESDVSIELSTDKAKVEQIHALGYFSPGDNSVWVYIGNRNTADILRTLAHELVHVKQHEEGVKIDGSTGSKDENEANSVAGVIMRIYGKKNPSIYN